MPLLNFLVYLVTCSKTNAEGDDANTTTLGEKKSMKKQGITNGYWRITVECINREAAR